MWNFLQVKLKRAFPYNLALILCWSVICPSITQFFLSSRWEEEILGTSKSYQDIKVLMIFCETYRTIPRYAQDMSKICPRYTQDMPKICRRYARDMPKICRRYAQDMPKICPRYAQDMHEICLRYAQDMPKICPRYAQDSCHK